MTAPFEHREVVRWSDVDCQGVLNNAVFLTLFEQCRFAYFRALGCMDGDRFPFVLGSTAVRFLRPGRAGMELAIRGRVTRLGRASFDMEYAVEAEEAIATGTATLVWVDDELRSRPIPAAVRSAIGAREGWPAS